MYLGQFFAEALDAPCHAISYLVSRELAARYPGRALIEGTDCDFDLDAYAEAGHCRVELDDSEHHQFDTTWNRETGIVTYALNAWQVVSWRGHTFDVVRMTWGESSTRHWILSDSREAAEQFYSAVCRFNPDLSGNVLVFECGYWNRSERLFASIQAASFDQLVLGNNLAADLSADLSRFFAARDLYRDHGIPWKRGLLLCGPPGNGKTMAVKALARLIGKPCLYVKSFSSEQTLDQTNLRAIFGRARAQAPCLLILEDLDSLVTPANRSFFLNEMDGFAGNDGLVTIATTNHPEKLDPALADRPSRFDRKYHFSLPGLEERLAYARKWETTLSPALRPSEAGMRAVAEATDGFSFAYLKELFVSCLLRWADSGESFGMDAILLAQAEALCEQMSRPAAE